MSVVTEIMGVFSSVGEWIGTAVSSVLPMFYSDEAGLTFLGALSVMGLAFSVGFLLIRLVQNFLNFRS